MRLDDCFGLVWKRKTTLFSSMKTPIDGLFIQNYLPGKDDLRRVKQVDPKEVPYYETICPIMPENFLKEFGVTQDENVLSIQAIFEKTREQINAYNRMKRELAEQQRWAGANAAFNQLIRGTNRRHGRF